MPGVILTAGRSMVLPTEFNVIRIAITNPAVGRCRRGRAAQNLINQKTAGTIAPDCLGDAQRHAVQSCRRAAGRDASQLQALFPAKTSVSGSDNAKQSFRRCVEHQRDAARRGNRPGVGHRPGGAINVSEGPAAAKASRCCCR